MSWIGFFSLSKLWLLALALPIILFYFLKLRRPRMAVPSLVLWQKVMNDQRVNSPFQKFKRNLLLLLQLLLLVAISLAAAQPFVGGNASDAESIPILIDHSASMAAVQPGGKITRLDLAKRDLHELIDNLLPNQQLSLIAVGSTAQRLTDFTDNKRRLHEAVNRLEVAPVESNLIDGLRVAQALAQTRSVKKVMLLTDGNVPPNIPFDLPFSLSYQRLDPAGPNLGITQLNARRAGPTSWEVFARVESSVSSENAAPLTGEIEIKLGDEVIATERVSLEPRAPTLTASQTTESNESSETTTEPAPSGPAASEQRFAVRVDIEANTTVSATLKPAGFDSLASDNFAALPLAMPRPLAVYCPEELDSFRHALGTMAQVNLFPNAQTSDAEPYDLLISDQLADLEKTASIVLMVGQIPKDLEQLVSTRTNLAELVDWKRNEPILRHVQLEDVQIGEEPVNAEGIVDADYEELGYEILAFGASGPLFLRKQLPARTEYYFLAHTELTTLPYRIGFPILVSNLIQETLRRLGLLELRAGQTGILEPLALEPRTTYTVRGPGNNSVSVQSDAEGNLAGVAAPAIGAYQIFQGNQPVATAFASLLSSRETSLAAVDSLQFREVVVSADAEDISTDKPLWRYFAFAGLALLMTEWWYFQRRAGGRP